MQVALIGLGMVAKMHAAAIAATGGKVALRGVLARREAAARKLAAGLDPPARIATGALGDIAAVELRVPWWRDRACYNAPGRGTCARDGGGVLITKAIHALDLMLWLAGPVVAVRALTGTTRLHAMEAEDSAAAGLGFARGAPGSVMATTADWHRDVIAGSSQALEVHALIDAMVASSREGRRVEPQGEAGHG